MLLMSNKPHTLFPHTHTLSPSRKYVWSTQIQAESVLGLGQQRPTWTQAEVVLGLEQQRPTRTQAEVVLGLEHKV
jgi:hypothetical protein